MRKIRLRKRIKIYFHLQMGVIKKINLKRMKETILYKNVQAKKYFYKSLVNMKEKTQIISFDIRPEIKDLIKIDNIQHL